MAELNFNAQAFDSQQLPAALPAQHNDPFPPEWGFTAEQKSYLGTNSMFLGVLDTPEKVKRHIELNNAERSRIAALQQQDEDRAAKYDPVKRAQAIEARAAHALVVNEANAKWRAAIKERARVIAEQDVIVEAARLEFKRLKDQKV